MNFIGVPSDITTIAHLCCGYPSYLDHDGYKKADKELYVKLGKQLDDSGIDQVIYFSCNTNLLYEFYFMRLKNHLDIILMTFIFSSSRLRMQKRVMT